MKKSFIAEKNIRIVQWFKDNVPHLSYNYLQASMRRKDIKVNGIKIDTHYQLKAGDNISIWDKIYDYNHKKSNVIELTDKKISKKQYLKIIDHTLEYVVIDKYSGIPSQNGTKAKTSILDILKVQLKTKPYIVHRLDKDVSGLMVVGLDADAARALSVTLKNHEWKKRYIAILDMTPVEYRYFKSNLPRHPSSIIDSSSIHDDIDGKSAMTRYKLLGYTSEDVKWPLDISKIEKYSTSQEAKCVFELEAITGRKHQLRIHCAKYIAPIIGDHKYGTKGKKIMLRCNYLKFKINNNYFEYCV